MTSEKETCPICEDDFEPGDICATDIELGCCHSTYLEGSPTVDLDTGEATGLPIVSYRYER